ncbi:LOW QUALITY PROTEIN: transmembrane protein 270 [Myotis lucifugus]|uniref:LOW QUALITY PROTEIN: transmembrane protein 270 n=1 Tax=Myotis lucifugus TaxID=59463 RepID=UPI0003C45690|nr:LOW QUALITY PROTEIN: transmembrane protein 270 [Myotis lucifugus]
MDSWRRGRRPDVEAVPPSGSSLMGILLLVVKLSVLLVQNRVHLYNVLLLKIILFNHWLSGLLQQAQGSCSQQAHPLPGLTARARSLPYGLGWALMEVPVWLVLRVPRLVWAGMLGCARALGLDPNAAGIIKHLYWWVESTLVVTSWHLAYLVTWTTCLASHLLQAAFEHTAQLAQAQAQEAEPQEAESLFESPFFESLVLKAGPVLPEHETLGE